MVVRTLIWSIKACITENKYCLVENICLVLLLKHVYMHYDTVFSTAQYPSTV